MNPKITIKNYEQIMFRLVENDFDEPTKKDLLQQIENDELFKFEWESWQKTKFDDPLENYSDESRNLSEKIMLIAEPSHSQRSRIIYYWSAAASIVVLIASLFFLKSVFKSEPQKLAIEVIAKPKYSVFSKDSVIRIINSEQVLTKRSQSKHIDQTNSTLAFMDDSIVFNPVDNTPAIPIIEDSIQATTIVLTNVIEKAPRYKITIETIQLVDVEPQNIDLAQDRRGKINMILTNTKWKLKRKPNGEPDRIILSGEENSYLCINLNY